MSAIPNLPSIVVIGPQSTGKSSVLTRLIGHDILPKGSCLTTRCIVRIELRSLASDTFNHETKDINTILRKIDAIQRYLANSCAQNQSSETQDDMDIEQSFPIEAHTSEYAVFDDTPNSKYTFKNLKSQIQRRMNKIVQNNASEIDEKNHKENVIPNKDMSNHINLRKSDLQEKTKYSDISQHIVDKELKLTLFLRNTLPLTLIDLPGLINIAESSQYSNISEETHRIAFRYIRQPNTIMIAVINACVDIVNSNALNLIKNVDPSFQRTVGVLTKIDLLDNFERVKNILQNKVIFLLNGYYGLVNSNSSVEDNINKEKAFFQKNFHSRSVTQEDNHLSKNYHHGQFAPDNLGIQSFKTKLFQLFSSSIHEFIIFYKNRIKKEYNTLSDFINPNLYFKIIDKYIESISMTIKNGIERELYDCCTYGCNNVDYSNENLPDDLLSPAITEKLETTHSIILKDKNIRIPKTSIFMNESFFKNLLSLKINYIEQQLLDIISRMHSKMIDSIKKGSSQERECQNCKNENQLNQDDIFNTKVIETNDTIKDQKSNPKAGSFLKSILPFFSIPEKPVNKKDSREFSKKKTESNKKVLKQSNALQNTKVIEISNYPFLRSNIYHLNNLIISKLQNNKIIIENKLKDYIKIHLSHINLNHSDFRLQNLKKDFDISNLTNSLLKYYLSAYYEIIKKETVNYFVKITNFYFVIEIQENLKWEIMEKWKVENKKEIEKRIKDIKRILRIIKE